MHRRLLLLALCAAAATGSASAQPAGHLNVPGRDMVLSAFMALPGTQSNVHQWLGFARPDGQAEQMVPDLLMRQTLVLQDVSLLIFRPNGPYSVAESGEIYLGDVDASAKARPLGDQQLPLVRYTMPANESRLIVRVPIAAGRAYSGWRQPVVMHYGPAGIQINVKAHGYVVAN